ncbi:MAG: cytochrome P460 family protein [Desulfosarcinaceae bacterium]
MVRVALGVLAGALLLASTLPAAREGTIPLTAPGLRLKKEPLVVISAAHAYANRSFSLPRYRNAAGNPAKGWSRKYIATRRFSSDQSAWIYYRRKDLHHCVRLPSGGPAGPLCIWPGGSVIVIESYAANTPEGPGQPPLDIDVISKSRQNTPPYDKAFFAAEWSYARFTAQGDRSISDAKVAECHQCHAIAFQLTGDSVFTRFP